MKETIEGVITPGTEEIVRFIRTIGYQQACDRLVDIQLVEVYDDGASLVLGKGLPDNQSIRVRVHPDGHVSINPESMRIDQGPTTPHSQFLAVEQHIRHLSHTTVTEAYEAWAWPNAASANGPYGPRTKGQKGKPSRIEP